MKNINLFVLILLIIGISCGRKNKKDQSRTMEEYMEMGVPDIDKKWDLEDYSNAFMALSEIKWSKPFELPAKDSKKSGALYNHLISLKNMPFLHSSGTAMHEKALQYMDYLNVYEDLSDLYSDPRMKKLYYHRELIEISLYKLQIAQEMIDLGEKIQNSDDPADIAMQSGFPTIQENYVAILQNTLALQKNSSQFLETDLEVASDSVYNAVSRNQYWMDSSATEKIKQSINVAIDSASSDYVRTKYVDLSEML